MRSYYSTFLILLLVVLSKAISAQQGFDKSFYLIDIKPNYQFDPGTKHDLDSLLKTYHATSNDTLRLSILRIFSEGISDEYLWTRYNRYLYTYTLNKKDSLYMAYKALALYNFGYEEQYVKSDLTKAREQYMLAKEAFQATGSSDGVGAVLNNIAYIYQHEGNIEKSVELYTEAAKLFQKTNQPLGLTGIYVNLGDIYIKVDDFEKAEEFFKKALVHAVQTKQEQIVANVYNQLGVIYSNKKDRSAVMYYNRAIAIYKKNNNYSRTASSYNALAGYYQKIKDTLQFRSSIFSAYENALRSSDMQINSKAYDYVALYYLTKNDYLKALPFADSAYQFAKKISYPELIYSASLKLSTIYHKVGKPSMAYDFLNEAVAARDSIRHSDAKNSIIKSQFKLEYDKKEIQLKAEEEKKDFTRKSEKQKQQLMLALAILILLITFIVLFVVYRNYRAKQKSAQVLSEKNGIIQHQKELVELKQKEIIDSINYARLIQQAVLTGEDVWNEISKEHFILFKPKDIVSGDFYWAYNTQNRRSVFALADCTGHGVPGGFMSMLGNSFLNEILVENKMFKTDEILNKLRAKIIAALDQKGMTGQKDGMDISLCVWNKMDNTREFAGANNPLWLVRNNELIEYKANKMPIGAYLETITPFSSVSISLQKGDCIYLSTDGYADQFGGEKGKKMKYKPFMEFILKHSSMDMKTQNELLSEAFENWKSTYQQVDDVSVIGIRV